MDPEIESYIRHEVAKRMKWALGPLAAFNLALIAANTYAQVQMHRLLVAVEHQTQRVELETRRAEDLQRRLAAAM
jgi:hypothetical protein